jgi:hypothetical protein
MLFITYTTRALIESGCLRGSNDTLCYKDIVLRVVPNPYQLDRHVLVMEVALLFMKGKRNKSPVWHFIFEELGPIQDNLYFPRTRRQPRALPWFSIPCPGTGR